MSGMSDTEKEAYRKGQVNGLVGGVVGFIVFLAIATFTFWSSSFYSCMILADIARLLGLAIAFIIAMLFLAWLLKVIPLARTNRQR